MESSVSAAAIQIASLAPWVIISPLAGLLLNILVGKRLGEKGIGAIACLASGAAFGVSAALLALLSGEHEAVVAPLAQWMKIGALDIQWALRVDTLSVTMMLVVTGVGTLIHIYATGYMHDDVRHNGDPARYRRFFVYFNLFILAMLILVCANNYVMLFVGWEGVGLCSYLLIGFWFEKGLDGIGNARAAKKAFIVNRIGDFGLLIALFMIFWFFGTFDFDGVFEKVPEIATAAPAVLVAITLFMLLGVTGKSAQIPLFVWLPDAMAGPTPVSALIHAATMVTAGVYLVARSSALFLAAPAASAAVMWVGSLTAFFAATIAVGQNDIKKVLAYSTISQLGFMVAAVGMGAFVAGMFHLATHAFFKALLFLSAGSVILGIERGHALEHGHGHDDHIEDNHHQDAHFDPQDMRNMGGLQKRMPVTFLVYLIGALALAGIAPLAGFFSKDEILASALEVSPVVFGLLLAGAFLTAFYMGRQIFMVFFGKGRTGAANHATESAPIITVPLGLLALLSVIGGGLNFPGIYTLEHWLEPSLEHNLAVEFAMPVALTSVGLALLGILISWWIYGQRRMAVNEPDPLARSLGGLFNALKNKWWIDELYHAVIVNPYQSLSRFLADTFDLGGIDGIVNGFGTVSTSLAQALRKLQTGYVRTYTLMIVLGVAAILTYLVVR